MTTTDIKTKSAPVAEVNKRASSGSNNGQRKDFRSKGQGGQRQSRPKFQERPKEVDNKILDIRRVTRVVAGGRRMSFAVSIIIGDKALGVVGIGTGKANDTALAIQKAIKDAKKNAIKINKTDDSSIPYDIDAKYCASRVILFPNRGKGLVAGAAIREIALMAGLKDVTGKVISGSKNKLNTARAVIKALKPISTKYTFSAPKTAESFEVKK